MRNPKLVPYETIIRATSGEPEAVDECSCTVKKLETEKKDSPPTPHFAPEMEQFAPLQLVIIVQMTI